MKFNTIKELKEYLKAGNNLYIKPTSSKENIEIQKFLLNNGFVWNGQEKWIDPKTIKYYRIFYSYDTDKYRIMFGSIDLHRNVTLSLCDMSNLLKNNFINTLFEDIL